MEEASEEFAPCSAPDCKHKILRIETMRIFPKKMEFHPPKTHFAIIGSLNLPQLNFLSKRYVVRVYLGPPLQKILKLLISRRKYIFIRAIEGSFEQVAVNISGRRLSTKIPSFQIICILH